VICVYVWLEYSSLLDLILWTQRSGESEIPQHQPRYASSQWKSPDLYVLWDWLGWFIRRNRKRCNRTHLLYFIVRSSLGICTCVGNPAGTSGSNRGANEESKSKMRNKGPAVHSKQQMHRSVFLSSWAMAALHVEDSRAALSTYFKKYKHQIIAGSCGTNLQTVELYIKRGHTFGGPSD
jgi:hypothetical protein